jgi:hypothetical protein
LKKKKKKKRRLLKKRYNAKKTFKIETYILPTETKTVAYYKKDPSSRQGRRPMTKPQLS